MQINNYVDLEWKNNQNYSNHYGLYLVFSERRVSWTKTILPLAKNLGEDHDWVWPTKVRATQIVVLSVSGHTGSLRRIP